MWFISFTIFSFHKESLHFYIDLTKLLWTVLVNTFDLYSKYNICLVSFFSLLESSPACI